MVNIKGIEYFTVEDVIKKWNNVITKRTFYQYIWRGKIKPAMKFGRKLLFTQNEINRFENELKKNKAGRFSRL